MDLKRKLFSFFKKERPGTASQFVSSLFDKFPDLPKAQTLLLALFAIRKFSDSELTPGDIYSLHFVLTKYFSDNQADVLLEQSLKNSSSPQAALAAAKDIAVVSREARMELIEQILALYEPALALPDELTKIYKSICIELGFSEGFITDALKLDAETRLKREKVFTSGAGLMVALVVIIVFILAATYLKSVFFGFLLAYLCLPLEEFFETHFFRNKLMIKISAFFTWLASPIFRLKEKISHRFGYRKPPDQAEKYKKMRELLVLKSSLATVSTIFLLLVSLLALVSFILIPKAINAGHDIQNWAKNSEYIKKTEIAITNFIHAKTEDKKIEDVAPLGQNDIESAVTEMPIPDVDVAEKPAKDTSPEKTVAVTSSVPEKKKVMEDDIDFSYHLFERANWARILELVRADGRKYISENISDVVSLVFNNSKGLLTGLFSTAGTIGTIAFNVLLGIFFFFFFLQKLAMFRSSGTYSRKTDNEGTVGTWVVKGIFDSGWMPEAKQSSREEAALIIDRIVLMFNRWVRGYLAIIIVETILYALLFALFGVPYFPVLALIAGCTILLPFIGPIVSYVLTVTVCLVLLESSHLIIALIGVSLTYIVINGILEQLLFYPTLVGEAIGLTTLETIIVVLLGAFFGGITGMIFAVPAAAVLKYLIPKIYRIWIPKRELSHSSPPT